MPQERHPHPARLDFVASRSEFGGSRLVRMGLRLVARASRLVATGPRLVPTALRLVGTGPRLVPKALRSTISVFWIRDAVVACLEAGHAGHDVGQKIQVAVRYFNDAALRFNDALLTFQVGVVSIQVAPQNFNVAARTFNVAVSNRWFFARFVLFWDSWKRLRGYNGVEPRMKHG